MAASWRRSGSFIPLAIVLLGMMLSLFDLWICCFFFVISISCCDLFIYSNPFCIMLNSRARSRSISIIECFDY